MPKESPDRTIDADQDGRKFETFVSPACRMITLSSKGGLTQEGTLFDLTPVDALNIAKILNLTALVVLTRMHEDSDDQDQ